MRKLWRYNSLKVWHHMCTTLF